MNETTVQTYDYDAYGIPLMASGNTPNRFRYVGQLGYYKDADHAPSPKRAVEAGQAESGLWRASHLMLLGARYYDPFLGRFITQDPIGYAGGLNLYAYAGNNPVTGVDPDGLRPRRLFPNEWKLINCHLRALAECLLPLRGEYESGYRKLREDISRWKDARKKYTYDPRYQGVAWTKPPNPFGYWRGITIGTGLVGGLGGACEYSSNLAAQALMHEFMHFNEAYWNAYIRAGVGHGLKGCPTYTGGDPHEYYTDVALYFLVYADPRTGQCMKRVVAKCCCE